MNPEHKCTKDLSVDLIGNYVLCLGCGVCVPTKEELRPPLRPIHNIIFQDIRQIYPAIFMKNRTKFFYSEMWRYAYEKKVFRFTTMGETRGGKSEIDQTLALNYARIYNGLFRLGHYKNIDITYQDGTKIKLQEININTDTIHANQSAYLYYLRDKTRKRELVFAQMHIIDEDKENTGGIGTFSEEMEEANLNNIVAKFMQNEGWIRPKRFLDVNAPYGINCMIKDESNLMNWGLLYKIEMDSAGLREQNFLGWIGIALHDDQELRIAYQQKKNLWIEQELKGTINERAHRRRQAVETLLNDPEVTKHAIDKNGKVKWHHGIEAMKFLVEEAIMKEKIDNFNDTEIERIVHGVRALGEKKYGAEL